MVQITGVQDTVLHSFPYEDKKGKEYTVYTIGLKLEGKIVTVSATPDSDNEIPNAVKEQIVKTYRILGFTGEVSYRPYSQIVQYRS